MAIISPSHSQTQSSHVSLSPLAHQLEPFKLKMKYLYALASIVACAAAMSVSPSHPFAEHPLFSWHLNGRPQGTSINPGGPIQPCTYTTTSCTPLNTNSVETITVYEVQFPQTVTQSVDCHGCADVSVFTGCIFNPPVSFCLPTELQIPANDKV